MRAYWQRPDGQVVCIRSSGATRHRPLVSVVMPVYNGERHLEEAVDSLFGQTFRDFEIIAVDDGSTDATPFLLARLARRDERLIALRQPHLGLIEALQTGCHAARGVYIARMDADDVCDPQRLARQVEILQADRSVAVVTCGAVLVDDRGCPLERLPDWDPSRPLLALLPANPIVHGSVMMRRDALPRWPPYERPPEDYWLWVRLAEVGARFVHIPEPLYRFRVHQRRYSLQRLRGQASGIVDVQTYLLRRHVPRPPSPEWKAAVVRALESVAVHAWTAGRRRLAAWAHYLSERLLRRRWDPSPVGRRQAVLSYGWHRAPAHWYHAKAQWLVRCEQSAIALRSCVVNHPLFATP